MSLKDSAIVKGGLTAFMTNNATAVMAACAVRKAAADGPAAAQSAKDAYETDLVSVRVTNVLGQVPQKIFEAVSASIEGRDTLVKVPVMELSFAEYPGPAPRSNFSLPQEQVSPSNLKNAGLEVFWYLDLCQLDPRIEYVYDGNVRTYSLQIVIRVHTA